MQIRYDGSENWKLTTVPTYDLIQDGDDSLEIFPMSIVDVKS